VTTNKKKDKPENLRSGVLRGSASAAAILGRPVAAAASKNYEPVKIKPQWAKYYKRLLDLREQLQRQMAGLAKQSAEEVQGYSLHMADSGTDNFDRDFALSLLSSDQDAVYEIEAALNRIEKGTYGVCEVTTKAIPRVRLDAIPWTRYTVEAQAQLERDGSLRRRRLGSLGSIDSVSTTDVGEDEEPETEEKSKDKE
jgi:RNA polymerase-binding transcription factor DksA